MKKSLLFAMVVLGVLLVPTAVASASSTNGVGGAMPVYYDGNLMWMNFKLMPAPAQTPIHDLNGQINVVYQSDATPGFTSVVDAIPSDGMNPLWEEQQITFNPGSRRTSSSATQRSWRHKRPGRSPSATPMRCTGARSSASPWAEVGDRPSAVRTPACKQD